MILQYKRKGYIFLIPDLISLGLMIYYKATQNDLLNIFILSSLVLNIFTCYYFAKAKGYPGLVGGLGVSSILGLIFVLILKDKLDEQTVNNPQNNNQNYKA
jgi:hypothetical protein